MILSDYIINNIDLKLSDFEESISGIGFKGVMVFAPKIKYYWGIKGSGIKIYILSLI